MIDFGSKASKELRLKELDKLNELKRSECKKDNLPFFGTEYVDDYRNEYK